MPNRNSNNQNFSRNEEDRNYGKRDDSRFANNHDYTRRGRELTGDDFFYGGQNTQRDDWESRAFDNNPWDRREGMYNAGGRDFDERVRDSYGYGPQSEWSRVEDSRRLNRRPSPTWTGGEHGRGQQQSSHPGHGFMESVKSFFGVGPKGYKRSDERVREDVSEALARHPEVDASEIEVRVKEGHVTLAGSVESRYMRRLAEEAVENVQGVADVHLELAISTPSMETDRQAKQDTASGLAMRNEKPLRRSGSGRSKIQ